MDPIPSDLALLRAALHGLPDGVMLLRPVRDHAGTIVDLEWIFANHRAAALLELESEALPGRRLLELVPRCRDDGSFARYAAVAETGTPDEWLHRRCIKIGDGVMVLYREQRLEDDERRLHEADRQKDEFLAMLSHELRNPLAVVHSATELLETVDTSDAMIPRIQKVLQRQTTHMARLLDDLLDLARITSGKLTIDPVLLDLREVVREVVSDLEPGMRQQLRFAVELPSSPLWVHGDRIRLAQVTHNLLGNALKYTLPQGAVGLRLHAARGGAIITVTDSGIGLDPEFRPHLFKPFQQAPQDIARSAGGLGLGLAVSKTIIELHHGTIEARSAGRDHGSEFEVWLPLAQLQPQAPEGDPTRRKGAVQFLVVEDNEDGAELLAALLRARGHEVEIAARGDEALAAMQRTSPDVVLCDIGLPDIDGYEVARAIRADPRHAHTKLVALSGYGQEEDRRRSEEAGFDMHFTKPADVNAILKAIIVPGAR